MNHKTAAQIRQEFIDYFVQKCGHTFVPSSPCVPHDDPTLMFTNAGMNQFKDVFLGTGTRSYRRAANTQKCIRAGGKHNDLDDVGHDTYHHTFFEMLGNWSFGDYFKKEAIEWAWELLTKVWGVDPQRLHATYFEGDAAEGLEPDSEARDLWLKILPPERVHPGNKKDNFWEMGDTGPCGPCSEIHIDLTPDKSGGPLVNAGDARVMEVWNLVFIQFNRAADGKLSPLPAKHVDTGMGFERITSLLQGKKSNYDTDIFTPIFAAIRAVTGAPAYTGKLEAPADQSRDRKEAPSDPQIMVDVAYRVIADHLRTLTFALTDGATPSNEGRGYVLRRILRRAVRYGRQYLGTHEPFMCQLVPAVVECMGDAFPELTKSPQHVADIIRDEEQSFIKTLDRGIALFDEAANYAASHHHGRISGEDAFKLHDTYGFPIDLTELMAEERGMSVNIGEYERLMEEARERARSASKQESEELLSAVDAGFIERIPPCDDSAKYHLSESFESTIAACTNFGSRVPAVGAPIVIATRETCFYAEQGGQVGDTGTTSTSTGEIVIEIVQRHGDKIIHLGRIVKGSVAPGQLCRMSVSERRIPIMKNHTATHVMNWALREVLGDHVQQKGSLVDPDKTRFDFSHPSQVTDEQLGRIEELVNSQIEEDLEVFTAEADQKKAREINTLRAVFGEKYPDQVRVVSVGVPVDQLLDDPTNDEWMRYSVEFCGGTHVKRTSEIGRFRLVEESAVAKGIRRVTGVTAERALRAEADATAVARLLKVAAQADEMALPHRIAEITALMNQAELPVVERARFRADLAHLQERLKKVAKEQAKAGAADIVAKADQVLASAPRAGATAIITADMGTATIDQLRSACDSLRSRAGSAAILLAAENEGKVLLLAAMTPDVIAKGLKAGDLIKEIAPLVGGKGGGKPDLAQGGGPDVSRIGDVISAATASLKGRLA
ncbi:MAG TPA: alanine--tRNA ligase [Phycisphaerae bacterium]|nr:alanine--tRNA ligase [Phycisphaerae bacterium]